jgi:hypothetical protein
MRGREAGPQSPEFQADRMDQLTAGLHAHCMIADAVMLDRHMLALKAEIGKLATAFLVNRPLHVPLPSGTVVGVTAMLCAAMWSHDGAKLRILYAYGGRVDEIDASGLHLDERLPLLPYFDHLTAYRGGTAALARRRPQDCAPAVEEILLLAGEEAPPLGWRPPPLPP